MIQDVYFKVLGSECHEKFLVEVRLIWLSYYSAQLFHDQTQDLGAYPNLLEDKKITVRQRADNLQKGTSKCEIH